MPVSKGVPLVGVTVVVFADGATASVGVVRLNGDSPPKVSVGVASAPSAVDAGPELPPFAANAAAAAPPITAEMIMIFLREVFLFRTLLCGMTILEVAFR